MNFFYNLHNAKSILRSGDDKQLVFNDDSVVLHDDPSIDESIESEKLSPPPPPSILLYESGEFVIGSDIDLSKRDSF